MTIKEIYFQHLKQYILIPKLLLKYPYGKGRNFSRKMAKGMNNQKM